MGLGLAGIASYVVIKATYRGCSELIVIKMHRDLNDINIAHKCCNCKGGNTIALVLQRNWAEQRLKAHDGWSYTSNVLILKNLQIISDFHLNHFVLQKRRTKCLTHVKFNIWTGWMCRNVWNLFFYNNRRLSGACCGRLSKALPAFSYRKVIMIIMYQNKWYCNKKKDCLKPLYPTTAHVALPCY